MKNKKQTEKKQTEKKQTEKKQTEKKQTEKKQTEKKQTEEEQTEKKTSVWIPLECKNYENVAMEQSRGIAEFKRALNIVRDFIMKKNLVLYGGMAIDFSLKAAGHRGIYGEGLLPDYDFFSADNITDCHLLAQLLFDQNFKNVQSITAIHPFTRKIRITEVDYVADISFFPKPYYDFLPTISFRGFRIVHIDYQRIDLHRSLSFLYEGEPRPNYTNRMEKDIRRLKLIEENCALAEHEQKNVDLSGVLVGLFKRDLRQLKIKHGFCVAGIAAYGIYCEMIAEICAEFECDRPKIKECAIENDEIQTEFVEYFVKTWAFPKTQRHWTRTFDIFPEATNTDSEIYYNGYGSLLAASFCRFGNVVNIHYAMASFLFKYFATGCAHYIEYYKSCREIIIWAEGLIKKNINIQKYPFFINGTYFGTQNFSFAQLLAEMQEESEMKKLNLKLRPQIRFTPNKPVQKINVDEYLAYQIRGTEV